MRGKFHHECLIKFYGNIKIHFIYLTYSANLYSDNNAEGLNRNDQSLVRTPTLNVSRGLEVKSVTGAFICRRGSPEKLINVNGTSQDHRCSRQTTDAMPRTINPCVQYYSIGTSTCVTLHYTSNAVV